MHKWIMSLGCFFCWSISQCLGLDYGLDAKKEGTVKITRMHVFSERCSGSFYLSNLLKNNISFHSANYGHKHFTPWLDLPSKKFKGPKRYYSFKDNDDTLFIVLFRDPYAWLKSLHQKPHHAHRSLKDLSFSRFIRKPWILKDRNKVVIQQRKWNPYLDCNHHTKKPFKNVMQLRSAKIRNMLMIKDKVKNIYFLNYEKVRDNPKEVLKEIADNFCLELKPEFKPVLFYKGDKSQGVYKAKKYDPISNKDLQFINEQLDKDLEEMIGYRLKENE